MFKKQSSLTQILKKEKGLVTTPSLCITPDVGLIGQILPVMIAAKCIVVMVTRDPDANHGPV